MKRVIANHGDLVIRPIKTLKAPKTAEQKKLHVLQDSGATGNRHEVVSKKALISLWSKDGNEYLHCKNKFFIQHVGGDEEHGIQELEKGTWQVLHELEHDPWKNELKIVVD